MVELLLTIPGCGEVCAWTIRAYTDDINRFTNAKKYCSYAGLAPRVANWNETIRHGRITKRGPPELRTALVQVVMGLRRMKEKTLSWRLMQRYEKLKTAKGSGKTIIATARKIAVIIWRMLREDAEFEEGKMVDRNLAQKSERMSRQARAEDSEIIEERNISLITGKETVLTTETRSKKTGVARKKLLKTG